MPLVGNVFKLSAKSLLIPLELKATASATDAAIYKKMFGSITCKIWFVEKRRLWNN